VVAGHRETGDKVKTNRSETFFSIEERERIRQAVHSAELSSSGEIATMIADESDSYPDAALAASLFISALVALVAAVVTHHVTIWSYLPMVIILYWPSSCIIRILPSLKLAFVSKMRISTAVRLRAVRAFYEKGLFRTRNETGILIFMSLLERKVWILGDRGINERIDPLSWNKMADELASGISDGKGCDALCAVIERCGVELTRHFPRKKDDLNELEDSLIVE